MNLTYDADVKRPLYSKSVLRCGIGYPLSEDSRDSRSRETARTYVPFALLKLLVFNSYPYSV